MPKLNVGQVMEREAKAQARKDDWRSIYEDCYEFALPQRNLYSGSYEGGVSGKNKMSRLDCFRLIKNGVVWKQVALFPNRMNFKRNQC